MRKTSSVFKFSLHFHCESRYTSIQFYSILFDEKKLKSSLNYFLTVSFQKKKEEKKYTTSPITHITMQTLYLDKINTRFPFRSNTKN